MSTRNVQTPDAELLLGAPNPAVPDAMRKANGEPGTENTRFGTGKRGKAIPSASSPFPVPCSRFPIGSSVRALGEVSSGVRDKALALLNAATATYEQLGMAGYLQQAVTLREEALAVPGEPENVFRFDGRQWTVVWQGQPVRVRRASGLHYIAHLLRSPARWVSIIDLERAVASFAALSVGTEHRLDEDHLQMLVLGGGEPALDAQAIRQCRARLRELQGEREEAVRLNDHGRLAVIDAERDAIEKRLRQRRIGSEVEKLRKRISNAIHRSLRAITRQHPTLGQHLQKALARPQHGAWCYRPAEPIEWEL